MLLQSALDWCQQIDQIYENLTGIRWSWVQCELETVVFDPEKKIVTTKIIPCNITTLVWISIAQYLDWSWPPLWLMISFYASNLELGGPDLQKLGLFTAIHILDE